MENANLTLWLAWALFGSFLVWLVGKRYLPEVLKAPPIELVSETAPAPSAWLFCEEGTALDRRVQWFAIRPGGRTVVGARPRAATDDTHFVYLTADDIQEDHAIVTFEARTGRYRVEAVGTALVLHNNDPLDPGAPADLADGDTLDLGRTSRFRFTLTGPE